MISVCDVQAWFKITVAVGVVFRKGVVSPRRF